MRYFSLAVLSILGTATLATAGARPCSLRPGVDPCEAGDVCVKMRSNCNRGLDCEGYCRSGPLPPTTLVTSKTRPDVPKPTYQSCGGFRVEPVGCPEGEICIDDPYRPGCGMACDIPGICVRPVFCGGFAGIPCEDGKMCIDMPGDGCDPKNGGADCGGICV